MAALTVDPAEYHRRIEAEVDRILGTLSLNACGPDDASAIHVQGTHLADALLAQIPDLLAAGLTPAEAFDNQLRHAASMVITLGLRLNRLDPA